MSELNWLPLTGYGIDVPGEFGLSIRIFQEHGVEDFWDFQILDSDFKLIWSGFAFSLEATQKNSLAAAKFLQKALATQEVIRLSPQEDLEDLEDTNDDSNN